MGHETSYRGLPSSCGRWGLLYFLDRDGAREWKDPNIYDPLFDQLEQVTWSSPKMHVDVIVHKDPQDQKEGKGQEK